MGASASAAVDVCCLLRCIWAASRAPRGSAAALPSRVASLQRSHTAGAPRRLSRKKRKNPRVRVRNFLNLKIVEATVNLFTLWALFMEVRHLSPSCPERC